MKAYEILEIHFSLSPEYSKFYLNNTFKAIAGLSATVDEKVKYENYTKGDLLKKIAPVCFKYTLSQAKEEGVGRNLNIYVLLHKLNDSNKIIKAGSVKKPFLQTEKACYDYWDKEHKKAWYIENEEVRNYKIKITSVKRSNLLFSLPSKIEVVKTLLNEIKGKSIIFGNHIESLEEITENVVSSKKSKEENDKIRNDFDNNLINTIASFKVLKQGANLKDLDNCIIHSYYSTDLDLIQRVGRLRLNGDKIGNVFILLTIGTQEEVWFNKMITNLKDFKIETFLNIEDLLKKYKNNENN